MTACSQLLISLAVTSLDARLRASISFKPLLNWGSSAVFVSRLAM